MMKQKLGTQNFYQRLSFIGMAFSAASVLAGNFVPSESAKVPDPSREARMSWIATVWNIDWPSKPGLSPEQQQAELTALLDKAEQSKLNTLIFQVRSEGDAMYESQAKAPEPTSFWLTGESGAPLPKYDSLGKKGVEKLDPLAFAVKEAHKRGIELHAWVNPFRARATDSHPVSKDHPSVTKAPTTFQAGTQTWFNPGSKAAVQHTLDVIKDISTRYDVDGIHIDDYFYPYPVKGKAIYNDEGTPGRPSNDEEILKWRQNNVNTFVEDLYKTVHGAKDGSIRVGISPFGIAANDRPKGVQSGLNPAIDLAADAELWLKNGWLDYLSPQLYWRSGGPQDFVSLNKFWQEEAANPTGRHVWPGMGTERIENEKYSYEYGEKITEDGKKIKITRPPEEVANQINLIRESALKQGRSPGHAHWGFGTIKDDTKGVQAQLQKVYDDLALTPATPWLAPSGSAAPKKPRDFVVTSGKTGSILKWKPESPDAKIKWWVIQVGEGNPMKWRTEKILPGETSEIEINSIQNAEYLSIRAVDNFGRTSDPNVLEKSASKVDEALVIEDEKTHSK